MGEFGKLTWGAGPVDPNDTIRRAMKRLREPVPIEPDYLLTSERSHRRLTRDEARGYCAPWPPWRPPKRLRSAKGLMRAGMAARMAREIEAHLRQPGAVRRRELVVFGYDAYCQRSASIHGPDPSTAIDPEGTYLVAAHARARRGGEVQEARSSLRPLQVEPGTRPTEEQIGERIPLVALDLAQVFAGSAIRPGGWEFFPTEPERSFQIEAPGWRQTVWRS